MTAEAIKELVEQLTQDDEDILADWMAQRNSVAWDKQSSVIFRPVARG